jgi:tRNA(fMet)-specific endonuclease VapC
MKKVMQNYIHHITSQDFVYLTRISIIEILGGLKIKNALIQIQKFKEFIAQNQILELTPEASEISSNIFAELYKIGKHSGNYDILIAGIAVSHGVKLCTNNTKDYQHISNLELINWK